MQQGSGSKPVARIGGLALAGSSPECRDRHILDARDATLVTLNLRSLAARTIVVVPNGNRRGVSHGLRSMRLSRPVLSHFG